MAGGRLWTEEEQMFLEKWVNLRTMKWIAKKLSRTEQAIKDRLYNTGESAATILGMMTPAEVAREYGTTREHVYTLVKRGVLPARVLKARVPKMMIDPADAERLPKVSWDTLCFKKGEHHHMASVDKATAQKILDSPKHISHSKVAAQYGTSKTVVAGIRQRRTWKHLKPKSQWWEPVVRN